jgi:capsular polysaccharide biosynthesis protein
VAVLTDSAPGPVEHMIAVGYPAARVITLCPATTEPSLHAHLAAAGPFAAIVVTEAAAGEADLAGLYRRTLFHLEPGGQLLLADAHPGRPAPHGLWPLVSRMVALRDREAGRPATPDERQLVRATRRVTATGRRLAVANGTAALAKLRDAEVDVVLAARGRAVGEVLARIEGETVCSRSVIRDHRQDTRDRQIPPFEVPPLSLRRYTGAVCAPRQISVLDNVLLPDTYRHHLRPRLTTSGTTEVGPLFAQVEADLSSPRPVDGSIYQLDSEWSGHFGHLMTEQLSRLWGWSIAKERYPDLRAVVYKKVDDQPLAPWEVGFMKAAGIDPAEVVRIARPIRPERLIAATPMFSQPEYVSPRITGVWDLVGRGAEEASTLAERPGRIFVSRRQRTRRCHNQDELEAVFESAGFTVVHPEDLSFADQAAVFRQADVVAGFAGSGMFTLSLCPTPKRVLMVCSEGYIPHNEYLISAVRGHELDIFWSVPDSMRPGQAFSFDFRREGRHLERTLAELPQPA